MYICIYSIIYNVKQHCIYIASRTVTDILIVYSLRERRVCTEMQNVAHCHHQHN